MQYFTQAIWKAISDLTTDSTDHPLMQQLQAVRNNDAITFLHVAVAHRDHVVATVRAQTAAATVELQNRTDQLVVEQERL